MRVMFECGHEPVELHLLCRRLIHLSESVRNHSLDGLGQIIEIDNLCRWLWPQAVQPVEEIHQHFQSPVLAGLHCGAHVCPYSLLTRIFYETEVPLLERDGVVEEEQFSVFERKGDSVLGEVPREWTWDIGEQEGNVIDKGFGKNSGQSRECIVGTDSKALDSAIDKDENGSDGVDVLLNLSSNTLLVALVLVETASVGQSRCVKDVNLGKRLHMIITPKAPALTSMPFLLVSL